MKKITNKEMEKRMILLMYIDILFASATTSNDHAWRTELVNEMRKLRWAFAIGMSLDEIITLCKNNQTKFV